MKPYRFKKYYKDGTVKLNGGRASKPEYLYGEFDGLVGWEEYEKIATYDLSIQELLQIAMKGFNKFSNPLNPIIRIEIVNTETNEVVDFIEIKQNDKKNQ